MRHFVIMRPILIIVAGLFIFTQLLAQNTIHYSYDSAGNRTQRDTTTTNVAILPTERWNVMPIVSNDQPFAATFGEDVISEEGTSPRVNVWPGVMGKIKPIESHLHQQYSYIDDYCGKGSPHYVFLTVFRSLLTNEKIISTSFEK